MRACVWGGSRIMTLCLCVYMCLLLGPNLATQPKPKKTDPKNKCILYFESIRAYGGEG